MKNKWKIWKAGYQWQVYIHYVDSNFSVLYNVDSFDAAVKFITPRYPR